MSRWLKLDGLERIKVKDIQVGDVVLHRAGNMVEEFNVAHPHTLPTNGSYYLIDRLVSTSNADKGLLPGAIGYATFRDGSEHPGLMEDAERFVYHDNNVTHYVYADAVVDFVTAVKPVANAMADLPEKGKK